MKKYADTRSDGTIAIHITNHYVDLEPVVRGLAERFGFQTARVYHQRVKGQGIYRTDWMILSRNQALIWAVPDRFEFAG